ncbi:MAG: LEA type 2 family protein [Desulfobaccales bacterium]
MRIKPRFCAGDHPGRAWATPLGSACLWLLGVAVLVAAGCGVQELARGEIQPPKVTFQGLTVYQPTSGGWPLAANLLLENPNPQPLNLLGYNYQLWIEGRSVATGSSQEPVNLPAGGQTVARFPILVKLDTVLGFLPRFLQNPQQKVHYQISGSFRLASVMGGIIPVPFRFQGEAAPREGMEFLRPYLH